MKTMAEVLARHHISVGNEGGWYCSSFGCDHFAHFHEATQHQADTLTAAGYGPVQAVAVVHVAHDTEAHARSFNEGYETAMAQELADDPTTAQDWLDAKLKAAGAQALKDAADDFGDTYHGKWLRARAETLAAE